MKGIETTIASDRLSAAEYSGTINTGSLILNGAISGSLYGGMPNNKITALCGMAGTYKTYFVLQLAAQFQADNPEGKVIWYDSESATTTQMMQSRGVDTDRVFLPKPYTVEEVRNHMVQFLDQYNGLDQADREPIMIVIDSVSAYPSRKETQDSIDGRDTTDMTRAKAWASLFRVIQLRLSSAKVPLLCTSHTMMEIGAYVPTQKPKGAGESLIFAASTILMLRKSKLSEEVDGTKEQVGNIVTASVYKARFTREGKKVQCRMNFNTGLDPYYGLVDLALKHKVFKKVGKRIEVSSGESVFESVIEKNPKKYFTESVMSELEEAAKAEFCFGQDDNKNNTEDSETDVDTSTTD